LFEKSGIILESGEEILKRGKCKGRVPKGMGMRIKYGLRGGLVRKMEWEDVKGEMVLTTQRLIIVGEKGRIRKSVVPLLNLDLKCVKAVSTKKPLIGKEKLLLSMDLATGKLESTEMVIDNAPDWVAAIRDQIKVAA
jgi:hypothetical protein